MIKLGLLMLVTLVTWFTVLMVYGNGNLRADRRPAPAPQASAAQDAGAPDLPDQPARPAPEEAPSQIIPAASQTAARVQRFPGPPLEPSPEHADQAPESRESAAEGPVLYVTATRVNMRSGPGTNHPVISGIDRGTAVQALGPVGDWVQIRVPGGQTGFASGQFLSPEAP
nr:SH3 domain-containing protein [Paracoccus saliphilus]